MAFALGPIYLADNIIHILYTIFGAALLVVVGIFLYRTLPQVLQKQDNSSPDKIKKNMSNAFGKTESEIKDRVSSVQKDVKSATDSSRKSR